MTYFEEGLRAWINGASVKDCPYEEGSAAANEWIDGYFSDTASSSLDH